MEMRPWGSGCGPECGWGGQRVPAASDLGQRDRSGKGNICVGSGVARKMGAAWLLG